MLIKAIAELDCSDMLLVFAANKPASITHGAWSAAGPSHYGNPDPITPP